MLLASVSTPPTRTKAAIASDLARALDPVLLAAQAGIVPDPWQVVKETIPVEKICPTCGTLYDARSHNHKERRFCSHACSRVALYGTPARFWARVDRSQGDNACWPWTGARKPFGHGNLSWHGRYDVAHRIAYELTVGPITPGAVIRHRCDNPPCCNPRHLVPGTHADNVRDAHDRGRCATGERSGTAKLTAAEVAEIRQRYAAGGVRQRDIAADYRVSQTLIGLIVRGKRWRAA